MRSIYSVLPVASSTVELHQLVDQIVIGLLPGTTSNGSLIINDVKRGTFVSTNTAALAAILSGLLCKAATGGKSNCIRVSAKLFGQVTLLHVKSKTSGMAIGNIVSELQPMAEKLGGCLVVTSDELSGITVAFTFMNAVGRKCMWRA